MSLMRSLAAFSRHAYQWQSRSGQLHEQHRFELTQVRVDECCA
jgi:hypothetical protein